MRWTGSGAMKGDGKTIIYSGHSKEHLLGVGICLRSPVGRALIGGKPVNKRIITARGHTRHSKGYHNSGTYPPLWKLMITRNMISTKFYRTL